MLLDEVSDCRADWLGADGRSLARSPGATGSSGTKRRLVSHERKEAVVEVAGEPGDGDDKLTRGGSAAPVLRQNNSGGGALPEFRPGGAVLEEEHGGDAVRDISSS